MGAAGPPPVRRERAAKGSDALEDCGLRHARSEATKRPRDRRVMPPGPLIRVLFCSRYQTLDGNDFLSAAAGRGYSFGLARFVFGAGGSGRAFSSTRSIASTAASSSRSPAISLSFRRPELEPPLEPGADHGRMNVELAADGGRVAQRRGNPDQRGAQELLRLPLALRRAQLVQMARHQHGAAQVRKSLAVTA